MNIRIKCDELPYTHYDDRITENMAAVHCMFYSDPPKFHLNVETFNGSLILSPPKGEQLKEPLNIIVELYDFSEHTNKPEHPIYSGVSLHKEE